MFDLKNILQIKFWPNRQRVFVFLIFVIIAAFLWLMIKLSTEYTVNIQYNPQIVNSLTAGTFANKQNTTLNIQMRAQGYYLINQQLSKNHTLVIDLKDKRTLPLKADNQIHLSTNNIKERIAEAVGRNIEIIAVEPDTLYLKYSEPSTKRVPVIQNFTLKFEKEYRQIGKIIFEPDSITITGKQEILDTIKGIYTLPTVYTDLKNNLETNINLLPVSDIVLSQRRVKLTVPIERCTEQVIKSPINILNVSNPASILLLPPQVEIKYIVPLKHYADVKTSNFYIAVDFLQANDLNNNRKLKVQVLNIPKHVISVQINPEFVDFIQRKE